MNRYRWIPMVAAALILGAVTYGACATTVDEGSEGVVGGVQVDPTLPSDRSGVMPWQEMRLHLDAGPPREGTDPGEEQLPPDDPSVNPAPETALDLCHGVECGEGEICCHTTGTCYPAECFDCCDVVTDGLPGVDPAAVGTHTGPNDAPAFGGPPPPRTMPSTMPEPDGPRPNE